jgi:fumarate reductase flavoprotein subunit
VTSPGWDLVVAGAGGGLAGALRAAALGASVLVVEANPHFRASNNTAMSTAMVPAAGTRWQRAAGVEDSPARFLEDIMAKTAGEADRPLATALTEAGARLVEWLADDAGLPIELVTDFQYPGHSRLRCHSVPGRRGETILRRLAELASASERIDLAVPARLAEARHGGDGVWTAVVEYPDGSS